MVGEVCVTDGSRHDTVITFSEVRDGKIIHQTEFWPDPFEPASWYSPWVERGSQER